MRLLEVIKAPFDKGAAIPILLEGKEAISALFEFQLRVLCTERSLAANDVLGQSLTVAISDEGAAEPRKVNGVVRSFKAFGRAESGLLLYEFNLVPSFWLMTLVENCRIFQDKNAVEVIDEVLSAYSGAINAKIDISPTPPKRDYCVQYNESDFDFISRILTEEGACYFVKYSDTSGGRYDQELVIGNSGSSYFSCVQQNLESRQGDFYDNAVTNWRAGHSMHASEWRLNDYNPMTASQDLEVSAQSTSSVHSPFSSERYRAHGRFLDRARGEALVGIHQDCEERLSEFFEGASRYVHFAPGATSDFTTAPDDVDAERFVFVSVTHYVRDESGTAAHLSNEGEEAALEPIEYRNEFLAIPSTKVFRPPEEIRRLRMKGLHTGVVVGKENDDINTDEHGRIRVHFHWDRGGKGKEAPTCWLRVAQTFAGNGFGSQFIPRVGMEVLIDFVEEDPDRPI
ncbi:MAG: type VI secretion system tip protein TssI/VgrG, partial [Pseudomonadota bacterium]